LKKIRTGGFKDWRIQGLEKSKDWRNQEMKESGTGKPSTSGIQDYRNSGLQKK